MDTSIDEAVDALLNLQQNDVKEAQDVEQVEEEKEPIEAKIEAQNDIEEPQEEEKEESKKFRFEYNGQEIEVEESELIKGYKRQSDLTKSFQEAAEVRKQAELVAQEMRQTAQLLQERGQVLDILDKVLETPPIDQQTLKEYLDAGDTEGYLRAKEELDQWQTKKVAVQQQRQDLNRLLAEAQLKDLQAAQARERELLVKQYPELANQENAAKLTKYLLDMGYSQQDLATVIDHRNFIIADKARKFDELMAKTANTKPTREAPKVIKKGAAPVVTEYKSESYKKAQARLKQSGSMQDAVELLLAKKQFK